MDPVSWSVAAPAIGSAFFASLVEAVEAFTIVLAAATLRGWRPAIGGAVAGLGVLTALIVVLGPLVEHIPLRWLQLVIGILLMLFGIGWLRKAILRAAGVIPLHDEAAIFASERAQLTRSTGERSTPLDWIAGLTAFKAVRPRSSPRACCARLLIASYTLSEANIAAFRSAGGARIALRNQPMPNGIKRMPMTGCSAPAKRDMLQQRAERDNARCARAEPATAPPIAGRQPRKVAAAGAIGEGFHRLDQRGEKAEPIAGAATLQLTGSMLPPVGRICNKFGGRMVAPTT